MSFTAGGGGGARGLPQPGRYQYLCSGSLEALEVDDEAGDADAFEGTYDAFQAIAEDAATAAHSVLDEMVTVGAHFEDRCVHTEACLAALGAVSELALESDSCDRSEVDDDNIEVLLGVDIRTGERAGGRVGQQGRDLEHESPVATAVRAAKPIRRGGPWTPGSRPQDLRSKRSGTSPSSKASGGPPVRPKARRGTVRTRARPQSTGRAASARAKETTADASADTLCDPCTHMDACEDARGGRAYAALSRAGKERVDGGGDESLLSADDVGVEVHGIDGGMHTAQDQADGAVGGAAARGAGGLRCCVLM